MRRVINMDSIRKLKKLSKTTFGIAVMYFCQNCNHTINPTLILPRQPLSHVFQRQPKPDLFWTPRFTFCPACALTQQIDPPSPDVLRIPEPRFKIKEPETHLDQMVCDLIELLPGHANLMLAGLSEHDVKTLDRFHQRGFSRQWYWPNRRARHLPPGASVETIQQHLSDAKGPSKKKKADLLVARHILEHVQDLPRFLDGIRKQLAPGGVVVFEVPDCELNFKQNDYTTLWDQHISYFTQRTLTRVLQNHQFEVKLQKRYPHQFQDSLVVIAEPIESGKTLSLPIYKPGFDELHLAQNFFEHFTEIQNQLLKQIQLLHQHTPPVLFGAGHRAHMFVHAFGLTRYFSAIIDENPQKIGGYLPGTTIAIKSPDFLIKNQVKECLLCLNPWYEQEIMDRYKTYEQQDGHFYSIFPSSKLAMKSLLRSSK